MELPLVCYTVVGPLLLSVIWMRYKGLEYVIINYRWLFVCIFLLPVSVVYDVFMYVRNKIVFRLNSAPKQHEARVRKVQEQVRTVLASHCWIYCKKIYCYVYVHVRV